MHNLHNENHMSLKKNKENRQTKDQVSDITEVDSEIEKKATKSPKQDSGIRDAMDAIRAKFGEDSIMKLGEKPKVNVNAVPTGSLGLDWALGIGGVPRGRII